MKRRMPRSKTAARIRRPKTNRLKAKLKAKDLRRRVRVSR